MQHKGAHTRHDSLPTFEVSLLAIRLRIFAAGRIRASLVIVTSENMPRQAEGLLALSVEKETAFRLVTAANKPQTFSTVKPVSSGSIQP
jgi:hypothetical protein